MHAASTRIRLGAPDAASSMRSHAHALAPVRNRIVACRSASYQVSPENPQPEATIASIYNGGGLLSQQQEQEWRRLAMELDAAELDAAVNERHAPFRSKRIAEKL